jgi:hypothetical protein
MFPLIKSSFFYFMFIDFILFGCLKGNASKWWLYLPGAIAFGLGSWQIVRREEKVSVFFHSIHYNLLSMAHRHSRGWDIVQRYSRNLDGSIIYMACNTVKRSSFK